MVRFDSAVTQANRLALRVRRLEIIGGVASRAGQACDRSQPDHLGTGERPGRKNQLEKLKKLGCTLVFYESCHRILASLQDINTVYGGKEIAVARELTKKFEEILRASPEIIRQKLSKTKPRGEFVIVI